MLWNKSIMLEKSGIAYVDIYTHKDCYSAYVNSNINHKWHMQEHRNPIMGTRKSHVLR